ncbi:MAG: RagB/SusD family nutrient uptake outer membrane protein [Anditalea sp.]
MKSRILALFFTIVLSSCINDVLDRQPLNLIVDPDVWQSEQLVDIYLVALYDAIPIGFPTSPAAFQSNFTDESSYHEENPPVSNYGAQSISLNTGMYSWIRKANYFLDKIMTSSLSESQINSLAAECRFIRAYYYFDLVKKYGGMPIITEVQTFEDNLEELQVTRNKEDEVYEFILKELDEAIMDLPEEWDANNENRATKSVGLALKSRAMLYAGSIAKYGSVQLDGLIGIPSEKTDKYFTASLDASTAIIESNKFALYDQLYDPAAGSGDPSANYQNIFLDENNKEIIFQKAYSFPDKAHSYDNFNVPEGYTTNQGSAICPTLEMAESYENIDGTTGKFDIENKEFDSPEDLYKNKDPRFDGSILRSGSPFADRPVQIYRGIYDESGTLYESLAPFPQDPSINQVGLDGPFPTGNFSKTGFYIKKYLVTTSAVVEPGFSDQNYIDIRYGEILLNYAEAAFELGEKSNALAAINQIRARAGIKSLTDAELTLSRLRNERKVELAFEDKRFWDIRRWRIGTELFRSTYVGGLWPYLNYNNGDYTYTFELVSGYPIDGGLPRIFNQRDYYSNLSGYITTNNNIVNNPGW